MKAVIQRVTRASVMVDEQTVAEITRGILILLGIIEGDGQAQSTYLAEKIAQFRLFPDETGKMGKSLLEVGGQALVVSQFTLAADGRKGRRPDFSQAAAVEIAIPLYEHFVGQLRTLGIATQTGIFGAYMNVALVNDGPVTFVLESK